MHQEPREQPQLPAKARRCWALVSTGQQIRALHRHTSVTLPLNRHKVLILLNKYLHKK